jgi:murein DD-endopeptidase MepM/ murein hydrolase activator NlpD
MARLIFQLILRAAVAFGGWITGSLYPAPEGLLTRLNAPALEQRAIASLHAVDWRALKQKLSAAQLTDLRDNLMGEAAAAGELIVSERTEDAAAAPVDIPTSAATAVVASNTAFEPTLSECPGMTITNGPLADAHRLVRNYAPVVKVSGVPLAVNPTHGACLSSGFGARDGHLHKGVDYHSELGGPILAAGDGAIVEMKYRDDYGNMLLIDHGHGVYTRYAHLSAFQKGLAVGSRVKAGDMIGLMGNTAGYPLPIHLHYELLLGDYNNPKASFGLTPHSPFEYRG